MDSFRDRLMQTFLPSVLPGMAFGDWFRLWRENHGAVDRPYWFKAWLLFNISVYNSAAKHIQSAIYGRRVARAEVKSPVFILGHWRTGTTHLHNLLGIDKRFAYPTYLDVFAPHSLFHPPIGARLALKLFAPKTRPMDNVALNLGMPQEDEFALNVLGAPSPYPMMIFLRSQERYRPFLTFRDAKPEERDRWKAILTRYAKGLTAKYGGRPLVLKSPPHTGRVKLILEAFPDAKFVHILREPYTVFASTHNLFLKLGQVMHLQRRPPDHAEAIKRPILEMYKEMYDALFEDRKQIPEGRYHEVRFEDLEKDPMGQMRTVYERLNLPDFAATEGPLQAYVDSLGGYKKNTYKPLPEPLRQQIAAAWTPFFEAWGYPLNPAAG
jgi:hypothetical protein